MAEERDHKLSQHYRELEALEPPPELDQAILAAARRATQTPRAPRIAPLGRRRWYYPLAAAAVLVFAVALTLHLERERPDAQPPPQAAAPQLRLEHELHGEIRSAPATDRLAAEQKPRPAPQRQAGSAFTPDPRAESATSRPPSAAQVDEGSVRREAPESRAAAQPQLRLRPEAALASQPTPEQWLERIAELRSRGRHDEADKALAEFRRAYPDYRLTDAMRERVERR